MKSSETSREGFVLPAVIFTMAILGLLAVAALTTANDEHRSSRAIRESGAALYAAEAGAHLILGTVVDSPLTVLDTLAAGGMASGDSVDLGWSTLPSGAAYHPVFHRIDGGGKDMYLLMMVGRGAGPWGGERRISLALTSSPGPGGTLNIPAAWAVAGPTIIGAGAVADGNDNIPPGWGGACDPPGPAIPGVTAPNASDIDVNPGPVLGDPPTVVAPFDVTHFDSLFTALVAEANHTILSRITGGVGPTLNADLTCNTSDPLNWGAPEDPTHACFDYFPIIYIPDGMNITEDGAGQGIFLTDNDTQANSGFDFYGLIMSHGTENNNDSNIYGAVYSDNGGWQNEIENGSDMLYSSCALSRAAVAIGGGAGGGVLVLIGSRAWSEF